MNIVPAKNGWLWLKRGFSLFRKSPLLWTLLVFNYWLLIALLDLIPYAGPVLATLLLPAFSVSFMEMCNELDNGRGLRPALLLTGFRKELPTLINMGGLYLLSILLVLGLSALADGGTLFNWLVRGTAPPVSAITDGSLTLALLVAGVAGTPVVMAFWFAPVLAAWDKMSAVKALFFSFFAGWRNWRAFLIYSAALALALVALSIALTVTTLLMRKHPELLRMALLVATLVCLPILFGSFYAGYRDIFPREPAPEAQASVAP